MEKLPLSTEIAVYLGNRTRYAHSYYGTLIDQSLAGDRQTIAQAILHCYRHRHIIPHTCSCIFADSQSTLSPCRIGKMTPIWICLRHRQQQINKPTACNPERRNVCANWRSGLSLSRLTAGHSVMCIRLIWVMRPCFELFKKTIYYLNSGTLFKYYLNSQFEPLFEIVHLNSHLLFK